MTAPDVPAACTGARPTLHLRGFGVDVGGSGVKGGIVDLDTGQLIGERFKLDTPQPSTPEAVAKTVAAVIITLLLYWLAHSYADLAGARLRSGARLTARALLATMLRELPILVGAAIPLGTLLICWVAGTGLSAAVLAAVWTSAGIVLAIELAAGLRGRLRGWQLLSQAFVGALLGSLIILLRGVLH